jgi:hypothetical protein
LRHGCHVQRRPQYGSAAHPHLPRHNTGDHYFHLVVRVVIDGVRAWNTWFIIRPPSGRSRPKRRMRRA